MTITLRLGYTESTLLYYFYIQTFTTNIELSSQVPRGISKLGNPLHLNLKNNNIAGRLNASPFRKPNLFNHQFDNIHDSSVQLQDAHILGINSMLPWFYKTSGYYDKTIRDIGLHCTRSHNYIQYFEILIAAIRNSTVTILLLHLQPIDDLNNQDNRNAFRNYLHNKVFISGIDDFHHHYVSPRFMSRHILVINPLSELMLEQYKSGNVYKAHNDFPPSVVDMMTYKSINTFFNDGPDNNNLETCEKMCNEILDMDRVYDTIWISCGSYSCLIAYYLSKHIDVNIIIFGGTDINNIFAINHQRNEILNPRGTYNEFWVSVPEHLKPHNYKLIEGGCYW
jgi:hypothetical protein